MAAAVCYTCYVFVTRVRNETQLWWAAGGEGAGHRTVNRTALTIFCLFVWLGLQAYKSSRGCSALHTEHCYLLLYQHIIIIESPVGGCEITSSSLSSPVFYSWLLWSGLPKLQQKISVRPHRQLQRTVLA